MHKGKPFRDYRESQQAMIRAYFTAIDRANKERDDLDTESEPEKTFSPVVVASGGRGQFPPVDNVSLSVSELRPIQYANDGTIRQMKTRFMEQGEHKSLSEFDPHTNFYGGLLWIP